MTGEHAHAWEPVPGLTAQYACACGATGYRRIFGGPIVAHAQPRARKGGTTARPVTSGVRGGRVRGHIAEDFGGGDEDE